MDKHDLVKKLRAAVEVATKQRFDAERKGLMSTLGQDVARMMEPFLKELAESSKVNKENMREAMMEIMATVNARELPGLDTAPVAQAIETAFERAAPPPRPIVNLPKVDMPAMRWPDGNMPIEGWVRLMGVSLENPLPVQLRDANGKPVSLDLGMIPMSGGGNSAKHDFFTIKGFGASAYAELMNADGRLKVSMESGSTGLTDAELRASAVPVSQVSGANWSVAVIDIFGSTAASGVFNGDNRIKVSVETGGSGLTDAELRASSVPVAQASGASWSTSASIVSVSDIFSTTAASSVVNPDNRVKVELPSFTQTVSVSGSVTSTGAYLLDGDGNYRGTVPVSDAGGSLTIDGSVSVSGSIASTVVTGPTVADAADDGSAPVQQGGIARQANPTAVAGGDVVKTSHDDLGRILTRPMQVRDLTLTAYASLTNGTETTLLAAQAGFYTDLIYVMGANNSGAAVTVDIRPVTAGNIVMTLQIPANGTAGIACPVPLPAGDTGNAWTADMGDITGTTVYLTALFSKEV